MNVRARILALSVSLILSVPSTGSGQSTSHEHVGKVDFANSCSAAVQETFQRGVALLHSFWFDESEKAFRAVLARDPACAIATWGIAAVQMGNSLGGDPPKAQLAQRAQAAIDQGRRMGAPTQRERDYIDAVAAYFRDWANRPLPALQLSRAKAFESLAARYPDDVEAQIFYALYLAATQSLADQTYASYLKAAAILERLFVQRPDHPGVAHYLIHCYDAPPIAHKGLPAARRYATIAPDSPHALHMPGHIFTLVGAWAESAATNERSAAASQRLKDPAGQLHAMDFMLYAYLQMARDGDARRVVEDATRVPGAYPEQSLNPYPIAAIPARYALERGDWRQAMTLQPPGSKWMNAEALTYFARALGAARSGDPTEAMRNAQGLGVLRDVIKQARNDYWATEVEINRLGAAAWTAWAQGKPEEALSLMREAADIEDKNEKHIITPARLLPARELLGEMLLELKRPAEALREFETSQRREPDRFRGLHGAAQAAAQSGDIAKAKRYFARLVEISGQGAARSELAKARAFLAANP